jgi:hypothetical protein
MDWNSGQYDQVYNQIAPAYQGWPRWQALADFYEARGGDMQRLPGQYGDQVRASSGGSQGDVNRAIEDSFKKLQEEMSSKYQAYKSSNPFNLDQILVEKTQEAKEQIDPYYDETLSNYLTGVTNKMERSTSDTQDLLTQLNADTDAYTSGAKLKLTEAINKSQEGYADTGLFNSGDRLKNEGLLKVTNQSDMENFNRNQDYRKNQAETGLSRTIEDLNLAKTQDVRNLERDRYTAEQSRAGDLTKEAGQQWVTGFKATLPPELQAQSGFDILKDIGIYS